MVCGSALYQEQKGRYRLIGYFSKKLPPPAQRYSISKLELPGIYANVTAFKHLLRNVNFTLYCDNSAFVHIMNGNREPYYFPGMFNLVREFVECCLECQSMKRKPNDPRIHYPRIPLDTRTMARMSMDIKEMPVSELGFKNILVCVCEFTNWIKAIPLANQKAQTIAVALYFKICCEYGTPKTIICDEAPAFTSIPLQEYFKSFNIQPIFISPMNHGSNRSQRYIRTLNDIITKNLTNTGSYWPLYIAPATFVMNCQVSHVTGFSPYQMVYNQKPPDRLDLILTQKSRE